MASDSVKPVLVALVDGSLIQGELNTRTYTRHGRLSDVFNTPESNFLVLTNAVFLRQTYALDTLSHSMDTVFLNKDQVVFAVPLEQASEDAAD